MHKRTRSLTYLASPYWHDDERVRIRRFHDICDYAAILMYRGHNVFAPVAHSHSIANYLTFSYRESAHAFWLQQDLAVLERCDLMIVHTLEGWDQSWGVAEEYWNAVNWDIPVQFHTQSGIWYPTYGALQALYNLHEARLPVEKQQAT